MLFSTLYQCHITSCTICTFDPLSSPFHYVCFLFDFTFPYHSFISFYIQFLDMPMQYSHTLPFTQFLFSFMLLIPIFPWFTFLSPNFCTNSPQFLMQPFSHSHVSYFMHSTIVSCPKLLQDPICILYGEHISSHFPLYFYPDPFPLCNNYPCISSILPLHTQIYTMPTLVLSPICNSPSCVILAPFPTQSNRISPISL